MSYLYQTEQFQTIQNYVSTFFDSLPKVQIFPDSVSSANHGDILIKKLLVQNQCYGKKIIELSEKFTSVYRKDHIFDKKQVQDKIKHIYQLTGRMTGERQQGSGKHQQQQSAEGIDQMLSETIKMLEQESNVLRSTKINVKNDFSKMNLINNENYPDGEYLLNLQQESNGPLQLNNMNEKQRYSHAAHISSENRQLIESSSQIEVDNRRSHPFRLHENLHLSNLHPNGGHEDGNTSLYDMQSNHTANTGASKKPSVQSKKSQGKPSKKKCGMTKILQEQDVPVRKVLKIKGLLQDEQSAIRQLFEKLSKQLTEFRISTVNVSTEKLNYTKMQDQTNRQNLESLLEASSANHCSNLANLSTLIDIFINGFDQKVKLEMQSQSKFALFTKQIDKREQVYSYAVSKLIGQVEALQEQIKRQNYQNCKQIGDNLISISSKFYELYPSSEIIKDLKVNNKKDKSDFEMINKKNYAVQVSGGSKLERVQSKGVDTTGRNNSSTQQLTLQLFKLSTKVNDIIDRFQKATKLKKTVDAKELTKVLYNVRECFPEKRSSSNNPQMAKFEDQYKKLIEQNQKTLKQLSEQYGKKLKKSEKHAKQLQEELNLIKTKNNQKLNVVEEQHKKLMKKHDSLMEKQKRLQKQKQQSQLVIQGIKQQIFKLNQKLMEQQLNYHHKHELAIRQNQSLANTIKTKEAQYMQLQESINTVKKQSSEEIQLYKKKIILLQAENQELREKVQRITNELEELANSSELSKEHLIQMTNTYEEKIKEVDTMIGAINQMKTEIQRKDSQIEDLQSMLESYKQEEQKIEAQLEKRMIESLKYKKENQALQAESKKYKELGQLNQSDIKILKQEMQKVHSAYQEGQEQLQKIRLQYQQTQQQNSLLRQQNSRLRKSSQETKKQALKLKTHSQSSDRQNHELKQQLQSQTSENQANKSRIQALNNELFLCKKQLKAVKLAQTQKETEIRQIRQQNQRLREQELLMKGKGKIQLQTLKVQLRKKTEQCQRIKQTSQQKLQLIDSKYKQLQKFISQKELLSKISSANSHHNHSTS